MAPVAMAMRQKLQFFLLKTVFLTKINIPAKFKENWLKTWENHIYQFSLALKVQWKFSTRKSEIDSFANAVVIIILMTVVVN